MPAARTPEQIRSELDTQRAELADAVEHCAASSAQPRTSAAS